MRDTRAEQAGGRNPDRHAEAELAARCLVFPEVGTNEDNEDNEEAEADEAEPVQRPAARTGISSAPLDAGGPVDNLGVGARGFARFRGPCHDVASPNLGRTRDCYGRLVGSA